MPPVDWGKYGYGKPDRPAGNGDRAQPPARPPFLPAAPNQPLLQIGPVPGRPVNLPVALAELARQALSRAGYQTAAEPSGLAELQYTATDEQVCVVSSRCAACGLVQRPGAERCGRCQAPSPTRLSTPLALTMFDLLVSSGLAHSPGKAALLLRHRAVEIDGQAVGPQPVPLREGSIIVTGEGLQARIVSPEPPAQMG